jgi:uncharacterized membrane protein (DUF2068 family)
VSELKQETRPGMEQPTPRGVRLVALLEATKAALVLAAGFGLLGLLHRDLPTLAAHLISRLHLNLANKYPRIFIDAASRVTDGYLWLLATLALAYATLRAIEAYGLWRNRAWAEWFAVITGAIYIPFELYELSQRVTWIRIGALIINILVVLYIGYEVAKSRNAKHAIPPSDETPSHSTVSDTSSCRR